MSQIVEYGIDLGTTNSCIARWQNGATKVFQNNDHMNVTPSAVHILKSGRMIVGRRAYSALLTDPNNVAVEFKRWMGQQDKINFPAVQKQLSAEELSSEILKSLKDDVKRQTGADVTAAVITVPAAFGALQCEATARAAILAGLEEAHLLQEPIAAAIGYGVKVEQANQRWMVLDLGGGTFDIAIVSSRDGRLDVLEHRGDNMMGGKDIDRSIVEEILVPALSEKYSLESSATHSLDTPFLARLKSKAEEAKIDLSTLQEVVVPIFDVGEDDEGKKIELEIPITRTQLEAIAEPVFARCCQLAKETLISARLNENDLDKILLVGGPTRTPLLRKMLERTFGVPLDFSVDPMTVVGQGAAVYASTLVRASTGQSRNSDGLVEMKLVYETVSADLQPIIAGKIVYPEQVEIRIDAEGGFWTSGWIEPAKGFFEVAVSLREGDLTSFWVYARDKRGNLLKLNTNEFKIRHGLVPSSPPLPHPICIELIGSNRKRVLDPIFMKGTALPANKKVRYRTEHALVPDNPKTDIAIKIWEGEYFSDPEANEWVGNALLSNEGIPRTVPEGAEVEVSITIDASRLITVEAFVPFLNQNFSHKVFAPLRDQQEFIELSKTAKDDLPSLESRLEELEQALSHKADSETAAELQEIRRSIDSLASMTSKGDGETTADPDEARRIVERSKKTRGKLSQLEQSAAGSADIQKIARFQDELTVAEEVVGTFGSNLEKQQLAMLRREFDRASGRRDDKAARRVLEEIEGLRWRVLGKQDWFWREIFESIQREGGPFSDPAAATDLVRKGTACVSSGDAEQLKLIIRELWKLQPKSLAETLQDKALKTGLRKF